MSYRSRRYLMCPPEYFTVSYVINAWMDPSIPVDAERAMNEWEQLVEAYRAAGHRVDLLEPVPGLPDMVFSANGATSIDGRVLGARFALPEREPEAEHHLAWHRSKAPELLYAEIREAAATNEAEGDFAVVGDHILAGHGFRTDPRAHAELSDLTGLPVYSLRLTDPRFYHVDVALGVIDDTPGRGLIAYYPSAFSPGAQRLLERLHPGAIKATDRDARAMGLNFVSDGQHVFVPQAATDLRQRLAEIGYEVIPLALPELLKGGGAIKCCTQEVRVST